MTSSESEIGQIATNKAAAWNDSEAFERNGFVAIRWLLAVVVIWSHSFPLCYGLGTEDLISRATQQVSGGALAVNIFLIISGFLMARSREKSANTWSFLKKRLLRIYPAFVTLMLLEAFVIAPLMTRETFRGYTLGQLGILAYNIFDLHDYGYPYGGLYKTFVNNPIPYEINSSLWTIRYEFICYILIALTWSMVKHRKCFLIGVTTIWLFSLPTWEPRWGSVTTAFLGAAYQWPRILAYFCAGVALYRFRKCISFNKYVASICAAILIIGALSPPYGLRITTPLCGGYLVLYIIFNPYIRKSRIPDLPDYSYGIYLYSWPIQQMLVQAFTPKILEPWSLFVLTVPLSILCGAISWHLVESRFLRLKQHQIMPTTCQTPC